MELLGQKVVALRKTSGFRDFDGCASYYKRIERNQPYLYCNGIDEEATLKNGETCYWCDAHPGMGDSYRESDMVLYTVWEKEQRSHA